jgi:dolichol-phosphate mannosyltransferase
MTMRDQSPDQMPRIAVIIPCYRVTEHIEAVIADIQADVDRIYVVDDKCPEGSGKLVEGSVQDDRVTVLYHDTNKGVGGATMTGFRQALDDGAEVLVKIDGDGQMDPHMIPAFVGPILSNQADCTKGNRFFNIDSVRSMPPVRLVGNAALSFMAKLSSGYWHIFDPNNGYLAIHGKVAEKLPWDKIANNYFFETDLLFRLNTIRAVVKEVPMDAVYGTEQSNLHAGRETARFAWGHTRNFIKRLFYTYYLRNFSVASLEIIVALAGLGFGTIYGAAKWYEAVSTGSVTPAGTVMLAALPVLVGVQSLLAFINHDILGVPDTPLHLSLRDWSGGLSALKQK